MFAMLITMVLTFNPAADYFPMNYGDVWGFGRITHADTTRSTIVDTYTVSGNKTFVYNYYLFDKRSFFKDAEGRVVEDLYDATRVWYDFKADVGSSWTITSISDLDTINGCTVTIISKDETAFTPASSTISDVVHFQFVCPSHEADRAGILDEWFAPNIGPIQRIIKYRSGNETWVLKYAIIDGYVLPDTKPVQSTNWGILKQQWR
jgi:hypothetical protein